MKTCNLFLLRGLVRESEHWGDFIETLQAKMPQANIFTFDIPGVGIYNHKPSPPSIPKIVEHVRQDYLNILKNPDYKELPNYIVAISLGGMLTVEWISKNPYDFKKAVVINSSLKGFSSLFKRMLPKNYPTLFKIAGAKSVEEKEENTLRMVCNNMQTFDKTLALWIKIQKKKPVSTYNAARQIWAAMTYTPTKVKPKTPILIINSAKDRLVDPNCSVDIANKWNLPILTHPEAGHDLSGDAPDWLADELSKWL
ncbi:MAG: alpha/beta fold hydrolase [Bacteriovoracaceae bacterium]